MNSWLELIKAQGDSLVSQEYILALSRQVQEFINSGIPETFSKNSDQNKPQGGLNTFLPAATDASQQIVPSGSRTKLVLTDSGRTYFISVKEKLLTHIIQAEEKPIDPECTLSLIDLIQMLNNEEHNALIVVQSNRDDVLRQFSASLVNNLFNDRKRRGANGPQVLFLYDEADEFMPSTMTGLGPSYGSSKAAITMLARRGRKFGLGLSFSTQRVAYLDTSILAQPHTYLISKLPRQYDREAVSSAFGLSEDMLRRTLKFSKGQWLLVSYEATGIENVPLPVQFPNANLRVKEFLQKINQANSQ